MRFIQTDDADLIATLNRPIHEHHVRLAPTFFTPYHHASISRVFRALMKQERNFFFLVLEEEIEIGYVWFEERISEANAFRQQQKTLYIHQISINPATKRKGYGKAVMEYAEQWAKTYGFPSIELDYWVGNEEAAGFYRRMGFIPKRQTVRKTREGE